MICKLARRKHCRDNICSAISVRGTYNRFYDAFKVTANSLYTDTTFSLLLIIVTLVVRYVRCTLAHINAVCLHDRVESGAVTSISS